MRKRGRPPYPDILTPREWEVLAHLREGLTNEQIAERLNVTVHAARYHVSEILSKLGVGSRGSRAWGRSSRRCGRLLALAETLPRRRPGQLQRPPDRHRGRILTWGPVVTNRDDNDAAELTPTPAFIAFVETMSRSQSRPSTRRPTE
jgi:DNA-binding CsgD family transcriptional regulator